MLGGIVLKVKKLGKLAVVMTAGAALVVTLLKDRKEKDKKEEIIEEK